MSTRKSTTRSSGRQASIDVNTTADSTSSAAKGKPGRKSDSTDKAIGVLPSKKRGVKNPRGVLDTDEKVSLKRRSLSSARAISLLDTGSSDSDSDTPSNSASHAEKRAAKAAAKAAASTAAEKKRLEDEEVIRSSKMAAAFTAKRADLLDDGLMSVAEYSATVAPNLIAGPAFPVVATHRTKDMAPVVTESVRIIVAKPNAALFHGAITGVVGELVEGTLIFMAKMVNFEIPVIGSSSSTDIPVVKSVVIVEVYQLYTPPDNRSSMRMGQLVATNGSNEVLPDPAVSDSSEKSLNPSEFISVLFDVKSKVYLVSLSNWTCLVQMLGHGGFRALPDIVRGDWMDPFAIKKVPSGDLPELLGDTTKSEVASVYDSADSSDSENDLIFFPADKVSGKVKADREAVRGQVGQLGYLAGNLTAPSANQIEFGLPSQHHLTSHASLDLARRLSKSNRKNKDSEANDMLATIGKSNNSSKLQYLGMADLVVEAISYVPQVALNNSIHDAAAHILDRIKSPICTSFLVSLLKSWSLSFEPKALFNFIPLHIHKGTRNAEIIMRQFEKFSSTEVGLDPEYVELVALHRIPEMNITLAMLEIATQNFLLCIFILWEMRLDVQDEMLRSVDRLFTWLRDNSVSSDNLAMLEFAVCACVEFFREWEKFRRDCRSVTYTGVVKLLQQVGSAIPDTGPQSMVVSLYTRFSLVDSAFPLSGLISNVSGNVPAIASPTSLVPVVVLTAAQTAKKVANKAARDAKKKNAKAAKALVAAVLPQNQAVPNTTGVVTAAKINKVCAQFHSTAGCVFAGSCHRIHHGDFVEW